MATPRFPEHMNMIKRLVAAQCGLIVTALGTMMTVGYASSDYTPAVLAVPMAEDLGVSPVWVFGAFSGALAMSALFAPTLGQGEAP
jgi:hypothetical protein